METKRKRQVEISRQRDRNEGSDRVIKVSVLFFNIFWHTDQRPLRRFRFSLCTSLVHRCFQTQMFVFRWTHFFKLKSELLTQSPNCISRADMKLKRVLASCQHSRSDRTHSSAAACAVSLHSAGPEPPRPPPGGSSRCRTPNPIMPLWSARCRGKRR